MEDSERRERMRRAMAEEGLDALALRLPENVLLLSGFWPMIGATVLLFPREGPAVCIVPDCYEGEARRSLWEGEVVYYPYGVLEAPEPTAALEDILVRMFRGRGWKRIGHEEDFETVAVPWNSAETIVPGLRARELLRSSFPGSELVDAHGLLQRERRRKTAQELEKLRIAAEISCFGLEAFERAAVVGSSGVELAAAVEREIMVRGTGHRGAFRVRAYAQVAVGPEETAAGYRPNEVPTQRRLAEGEIALLELGVVADGYWADRTRVRVAGEPTAAQRRVFQTVRRAQETAVAAVRAGVQAAAVDEAARAAIREAGYHASFPHITGHGVGLGYHEAGPKLSPDSGEILEEGVVTSVEPGIYFRPFGGMRLEDEVAVGAAGAEVLGPYRKELV